jgi:hypothetical protein
VTRWQFLRAAGNSRANSPGKADMTAPPENNDWRVRTVIVNDNEHITDLKVYGLRTAGSSSANPEVLKTVIGWIYHNKITVEDIHNTGEMRRISDIDLEIAALDAELGKIRNQKNEVRGSIQKDQEATASKQKDLAAVRAGDGTIIESHGLSDRMSFFIAAGILVVLTVYLFLFYVSAIYNAFLFDAAKSAEEGLRTGRELSVTIFNGEAFQKAWASGGMTFAFLSTAPSIVIGLGFLIHHFLRAKQKAIVVAIVGVTLLFDFLLAYEIVYQIDRIKLLTGETTVAWSIGVLVKSPEFYIILLAGFVVYIIWGLLLRAVLEGVEKFHPARVAIRALNDSILALEANTKRLENDLRDATRIEIDLTGKVGVLRQRRSPRELQNNVFQRHLEELMQGWLTYITQAFPEDREQMAAEAQRVRQETVALLTRA